VIALLFTYYQLQHERHDWWWKSFATAGGIAVWVFLYSLYFFYNTMEAHSLTSHIVYFVCMVPVSCGIACMMGFIGVATSLCFIKKLVAFFKCKLGSDIFPESDHDDREEAQTIPLMTYEPPTEECLEEQASRILVI